MQLAVFASGSGSNLESIFRAIDAGRLPARVALVVSNKAGAFALERARSRNVPTAVIDPGAYSEAEYLAIVHEALRIHDVTFVALAGYLRKIPSSLVAAFRGKMLNIHPALLPAFGGPGMFGQHIHRAVLEYGVRWTGVTVHLVDETYDTGPVVLQEPVPVYPDDTLEGLAARVLEVEHRLFPEALALFARGQVRVEGRRVWIETPPAS